MGSEATLFPPEAEALDSLWIPDSSSSMEGRFLQAQIKGDRNEGESYGEGFRQSAANKRRLTVDQVRLLERNFNVENKLEHERKVQLAKEIGLRPRQVAVWFQNRRARSKTKKVEKDYESLNTEYDKLKKDYDGLVKENQALIAEVDELRGKWAATEDLKNPFEPVEAMDSSATELGKQNTNTMDQILHNVKMGSWRQEEGSRSSSKSDAFYSGSPAMENQSQSDFLQDEEDELGYLGNLEDAISPDEFIDSFSSAVEDQPFCFWS